ncbi:uncharacterized protein LOC126373744 [Pectinophora gossypiella]|uniref:uncharacterized protein LOC126373744 n=1 Tax=Pectinophora gossypiella TaxID=13191 RepID=UPI00214ED0BA|nr:uncharacterized protein LOC126373744 [Pectinophora gossypiella]
MEHFIESVRKYPCLWNTTAIEYRDQELKDAAWAEVMKDTDLSSVKEVKLKWKKLRDSYRDALKRQSEMLAKEPGQAKKTYPWKYMGLMQFLQPHMSARKRPEPARPPDDFEPPANGHGAHAAHAAHGAHVSHASRRSSDSSDSEAPSEPKRRAAPPPAAPPAPAPLRLPEYTWRAAAAPDPLELFFEGMCQATKRLPYQTQLRIKRTLFEAVAGAEEALAAEQLSYASLWARGPPSSRSSSEPPEPERPA